ncbi:MAG: YihA family ribosome biogenesis GTP-binding protein [Campylobacterales bacterium]|nr:YihA family ribosome biogenesis GTP-binding protein [Campylobacterales bacterium]
MRIVDARFLESAQSIVDSPSPDLAEIAFLGRSNVGKSSLLNTLTNHKGLAKSSSTPGKTKLINFFDVTYQTEEKEKFKCRFVDLPGFGYAKVSKSLKKDWDIKLTQFIEKRASIRIYIHLIDARHKNLEIDKSVNEFLHTIKKGDQIVVNAFTKIDKLKQNELAKLKRENPNGIFISNLKKKGMNDLEQLIANFVFKGII